MDNTEQSRILSRVRKMMNLANDAGATEGERDNALRMAHATLAKYNLELSDATLAQNSNAAATEAREQCAEVFLGTVWARQIAQSSAKLFFCMYFYTKLGPNTDNVKHYFIGRHSNVVTAREMSQYLINSVHREAKAYQRTVRGSYEQYRSFATGAMNKIHARCSALRSEAEKNKAPRSATTTPATSGAVPIESGMALAVIYRNEETENGKFLAASGMSVRVKHTRTKGVDYGAYGAGQTYGSKVSLNKQLS